MQTDVVCDDLVLLTLQYSTQWDSFAHVGSLFDADGDGKPEPVFYNGFRAGEDIVPAKENPKAESWATLRGQPRRGARHPEPRRARRAGPRRDDRPARAFRQEAAGRRFRRFAENPRKRQGRSRARRHRLPAHRLRRDAAGVEEEPDARGAAQHLHRPRRPRREAAAVDLRLGPRGARRRQLRGRAVLRHALEDRQRTPCCRCTSTACSRTASTWASCGTSRRSRNWLREHKRNRFLLTAPPLRLPGAVGSPATPDRHRMKKKSQSLPVGIRHRRGDRHRALEARLVCRRQLFEKQGQGGRSRSKVHGLDPRPGRRRRGRRVPQARARRRSTSGAASTRW